MVNDGDYIALFQSIHRVMKAEKILKEQGLSILLIPAPRPLESDCGLAIRFTLDVRDAVEMALVEGETLPERLYQKKGEDYVSLAPFGKKAE